jgi:hypothetical protein
MGFPVLTRRLSWRSDLMTLAQCYPFVAYGILDTRLRIQR